MFFIFFGFLAKIRAKISERLCPWCKKCKIFFQKSFLVIYLVLKLFTNLWLNWSIFGDFRGGGSFFTPPREILIPKHPVRNRIKGNININQIYLMDDK